MSILALPLALLVTSFAHAAPEGSLPAIARCEPDPATFPLPEALRPAVRFWRDMFSRHESTRVIVHDRDNLDVVWHVLLLPRAEDGAVDEALVGETVRAKVEELRQRLDRLELDSTPIDEDDRVLLALAGGEPSRLRGAGARLRTQRGVADRFREALTRSRMWMDSIRETLANQGIPSEIAVLPFVESMFNPMARSHAGAAGLWQLMPKTARELGLKVSPTVDERLDVAKATRAAARLLRDNHRMLGSWPLALTAYNFGPYGLKRAIAAVGSDDLITLINGHEESTWGFAGKNFYAEFLAAYSLVIEAQAEDTAVSSIRN